MRSWALPLLCTVLFYGLAQGIYKQVPLSAGQFCLLLCAAKTVLNWGFWLAAGRRPLLQREARAFLGWALLGQLGNGVAWIFYFIALQKGPAALVGTVTAAYTAVAVLLSLIFLRERLAALQVLGVALVIAAGLMIGYSGGPADAPLQLGGWFAASLVTLLLWGIVVCIFKYAYGLRDADDSRFFVMNWLGMVLTLLPYGLSEHGAAWDLKLVFEGLAIVLLYAIGDLTLFAAINRGPASLVSPLSGLYPVITLIYAKLFLREAVSTWQWLAVAMLIVAIVLVVPQTENKEPTR